MNKTAVVRCFFTTDVYVPTKANAFAVRIVLCFFAKKTSRFLRLAMFCIFR